MHYPDIAQHHDLLTTRNLVRPIAWLWEFGRTVLVPVKLLSANRTGTPAVGRIFHSMIDDPVLGVVGRSGKGRMANTIRRLARVLIEDGIWVLPPVAGIHWVVTNKLELAKAIVAII